MGKTILIVLMHKRRASAPAVQRILTDHGCIIKTRLGIHDGVLDKCSDEGLIILELAGDRAEVKELETKLNAQDGVKTKLVEIAF